jgi:hypothetical protein
MNATLPDKSLCARQRQLALLVFKHYRELGTVRTVGAVCCNNVYKSKKNMSTDVYNSSEIMAFITVISISSYKPVGGTYLCNASFQHTPM